MKIQLALLMAVATIALAQGPRRGFGPGMMGGPGGPGPMAGPALSFDNIKSYLNLTDSQITGLEAIRTQAHTGNQQTITDLRTKEQALQTLLKQTNPDPAAVGKAVLDIEATRAKLQTSRSSLVDQAVALLTADQKAKLKTLSDAAALRPQIHEATMLNLLAPPADGGPGLMGGMGMRMRGR